VVIPAGRKRYYGKPISPTRAKQQQARIRRELKIVQRELAALRRFPPVRSERVPEAVISV